MLAVLGAGSWGSALAITIAENCSENVYLWTSKRDHAVVMERTRENNKYLPGVKFPHNIYITDDLEYIVKQAIDILVVIPSRGIKDIFYKLHAYGAQNIAWGTKGLVDGVGFIHELFKQIFNTKHYAIVTGPSFAKEVANHQHTSLVVGSPNVHFSNRLQKYLQNDWLHVYTHDDVLGVEIGGVVKNILAIACGIVSGLGLGSNAQAALITRGVAEGVRLSVALGSKTSTLYGLAGLGDIILTCTDNQSRNRRCGLLLSKGMSILEVQQEIKQEIEAVNNAKILMDIVHQYKISLPIIENVSAILMNRLDINEALVKILAKDHMYIC